MKKPQYDPGQQHFTVYFSMLFRNLWLQTFFREIKKVDKVNKLFLPSNFFSFIKNRICTKGKRFKDNWMHF